MISLPDGTTMQLKFANVSNVDASYFTFNAAPVCLLRGTAVLTDIGMRKIERLRPGDRVQVQDGSYEPILYIARTRFSFASGFHKMKPIRIPPNGLACGIPKRQLLLSPQHRVALPQTRPNALIAAKKLVGVFGVTVRPNCKKARYYHILLRQHALINAEGAWVESLLNTPLTRQSARIPLRLKSKSRIPALPLMRRLDDMVQLHTDKDQNMML